MDNPILVSNKMSGENRGTGVWYTIEKSSGVAVVKGVVSTPFIHQPMGKGHLWLSLLTLDS